PKRQRISRACDLCRKKKIKCDGQTPKCAHCETARADCHYTYVEKKRAAPKGAKYIEGLEDRLGRMESLLRNSGLLTGTDGATESAAAPSESSSRTPSHAQTLGEPPSQFTSPTLATRAKESAPQRDAAEADQMDILIQDRGGDSQFIGSASGFSIFSPKGIEWVNEKTGDNSFQQMIASVVEVQRYWDHKKPAIFSALNTKRQHFIALPSKQDCLLLLRDYFDHFNHILPLFHQPTFMRLVERHYGSEPDDSNSWWAALNITLAIALHLRASANPNSEEDKQRGWAHVQNAMSVITDLMLLSNNLLSIQALLGMALVLHGTSSTRPTHVLVAATIRAAHSIGLHKRGSGFGMSEAENEQRKRVFWIAYTLDKELCLRSGRPPAQHDDDMNISLPSENPSDNIGNVRVMNGGQPTVNLFHMMCRFAQIQSRVYNHLYSVKASKQSDTEQLNFIGELDAQLEEWKDSIPLDFRPGSPINATYGPLVLHVAMIHFSYYSCLTTIHRTSIHHGHLTKRLSAYGAQEHHNQRVFKGASLCVDAARSTITLLDYVPEGDISCVWMIIYYPVAALVTLFASILQNPHDAHARSDLQLMNRVVVFTSHLKHNALEEAGPVQGIAIMCTEFERIASIVLDKAERDGRAQRSGRDAPLQR
ncbi:hypothetical protein K470DRAFT_203499, partial [Piedraia hortae CBS 480.64]